MVWNIMTDVHCHGCFHVDGSDRGEDFFCSVLIFNVFYPKHLTMLL